MPNLDYEHSKPFLLNLSDNTIIPNAVNPIHSVLPSLHRLSKQMRILRS